MLTIFCITYLLFLTLLIETHWILGVPHLFRTALPFSMLCGPAGYFYIRSALQPEKDYRTAFWLHSVPFLVAIVLFLPYYLKSTAEKLADLEVIVKDTSVLFEVNQSIALHGTFYYIIVLSGFLYSALIIRELVKSRNTFSRNVSKEDYKWFVCYSVLFPCMYFSVISGSLLQSHPDYEHFTILFSCIATILMVSIYLRPTILYGLERELTPQPVESESKVMPAITTPVLEEVQIRQYIRQLEQCLENHKPYLKKGLSLNELSRQTEIPRHHLSWILNNVHGMNFNDFINQHRIRYIKQTITEDTFKRMTLEGVALQAGFNSRTTFALAVKKMSGKTPSEFFKHA